MSNTRKQSRIGKEAVAFGNDGDLYRSLVEHANDGIAIVQRSRLAYVNPRLATSLGYPAEEMIGTPYTRYLTPESLDAVTARYQTLSSRLEPPDIYEASLLHRTGKPVPFEVNTSVISLLGKPADFVIFRSLSERSEQRRNLERASQYQKLESLAVLAGGIAHDFNNLLQGILGNADLALMYESDPVLVRACLMDIKGAAKRAAELSGQMLAYSGRSSFNIQNADINRVVEGAEARFREVVPKQITLEYQLGRQLPTVRGDRNHLQQILVSLITNAVEAIGEYPGGITLRTGVKTCERSDLSNTYLDDNLPEGRYVFLEVADTGCGIDIDIKEKIFDPFFSTKFTGRGLGLASVLGIVRAHQGAIDVVSDTNAGCTVRLYLPCSSGEDTPRRITLPPQEKEAASNATTVLLVDDESAVRSTAKRILKQFGFDVMTASSGQSALDVYALHGHAIDLVLLDMTMPYMDGEETFQKLLALDRKVKTVLMSGYSKEDVIGRFNGVTPAGFLQKPFTARGLVRTVRKVLKKNA